ncbi:hypothetical protein ACHAXT_001168 [Thalassiosira profunda]
MSSQDPVTSEEEPPSHTTHEPEDDATHATEGGDLDGAAERSLVIPVTSSTNGNNYAADGKEGLFIEIFPEEMPAIRPTTLSTVLKDEKAPLKTWCDASLLYMKAKREREGCDLLNAAADGTDVLAGSNTDDRLRVLASAGIAAIAQAHRPVPAAAAEGGALDLEELLEASKNAERRDADRREELRGTADARFTKADGINQVYPLTWIGRGMLNLTQGRLDQARFFFENLTLQECGEILPALLGMAAVRFLEKDYAGAVELYGRAMRRYPVKSGAATRVGLGAACYKLGQIDRAKAAFKRARDMDPENVEALIGIAILEMGSLDPDVLDPREYRRRAEDVVRTISRASIVDHTNAVVQNHLANHYFWKWTPVPGTASAERGSDVVRGNMASSLEAGDLIRIGHDFETQVAADDDMTDDNAFKIKDAWKADSASALKLWKKDYDRVLSLARGAYHATHAPEVQAESLYMLARVFHARGEMDKANKFYDKACMLSPELSPARFGLAQTLIWDGSYGEASAHLRLLLGTCSNATDALAALGLLEAKAGKDRREAFAYLKRAIDLDPFNADLVLIEALAYQQHEGDYSLSLDRYRKAVRLLEAQGKAVPADVLTNMGVLAHETKQYGEALELYGRALTAAEAEGADAGGKSEEGEETLVRHADNRLFWKYDDLDFRVKASEGDDKTKLTLVGSQTDVETLGVKAGDDISIYGDIETTIKDVSKGDDGSIHIVVTDEVELKSPESKLSVKRDNGRLENQKTISIVFNLARLHESAGRIVAAIELHKAILKRHPSYVNCYLRLACIARDCGSLKDCSEWLKNAVAVAPGNPEVLTLVGNLHLSLCDWAPAQNVFDQLLQQKVPKVEAYSMLSMGNIYFNNLNTPKKYSKHLQHAADFYRRILQKDKANAYAANGLGTVLAEKGELFKAKEIFNRVREVSGDTISDSLLNLGHIYLAQKKHPEALQMYQSYMTRTSSSGAQTTSKSQEDDEAEVLLYIAFAYFDWAQQTEAFNNAKAAPADGRYKKCISYIEMAMKKSKRENVVLRYNWCLTKLQLANCVLQKVHRNIRRTAEEIKDALDGLEESLPVLETFLQWKKDGRKVPISNGMLTQVVSQCKHNIDSAKSHLKEQLHNEKEAETVRNYQRIDAEQNEKQRILAETLQKEADAAEMEAKEKKAMDKMDKVSKLVSGWKEAEAAKAASPKKKKAKGDAPPGGVDDEAGILDADVPANDASALFDDSDDDDSDAEEGAGGGAKDAEVPAAKGEPGTQKDLFGHSSSEEEMEDEPKKRPNESIDEEQAAKKQKIDEEED